MTGLQHVYLAYSVALILLGGYALLVVISLKSAQRAAGESHRRRR